MRKVVSKYVSILIIFTFTAIVILACGCDKKTMRNDSDSAIEADYKSEADTSEND